MADLIAKLEMDKERAKEIIYAHAQPCILQFLDIDKDNPRYNSHVETQLDVLSRFISQGETNEILYQAALSQPNKKKNRRK